MHYRISLPSRGARGYLIQVTNTLENYINQLKTFTSGLKLLGLEQATLEITQTEVLN